MFFWGGGGWGGGVGGRILLASQFSLFGDVCNVAIITQYIHIFFV